MKEFKGTKGEWEATKNSVFWEVHTNIKDRRLAFNILLYSGISEDLHHTEENEANAKLIAAAPELLEALQILNKAAYDGKQLEKARARATEAINKALGQ